MRAPRPCGVVIAFRAGVHFRRKITKSSSGRYSFRNRTRLEEPLAMATVEFEGEKREVPDGASVQKVCEEMGMPFGCTEGLCGTCRCRVAAGMENLAPLNEREEDMDLEEGERLACQCIVKSGTVAFSID